MACTGGETRRLYLGAWQLRLSAAYQGVPPCAVLHWDRRSLLYALHPSRVACGLSRCRSLLWGMSHGVRHATRPSALFSIAPSAATIVSWRAAARRTRSGVPIH